jgi:hypothetical protein
LLATTEVEEDWDLAVFDSETIRAGLEVVVEVEVEVEGVLLAIEGTAGLARVTGVEEEGTVFFEDTRRGEEEVVVEAEEGIAATRRVEEAVARA